MLLRPQPTPRRPPSTPLQSLYGNLDFRRFCSARLQAGTVDSSTCSSAAADERYRALHRVATQTPKPAQLSRKTAVVRLIAGLALKFRGTILSAAPKRRNRRAARAAISEVLKARTRRAAGGLDFMCWAGGPPKGSISERRNPAGAEPCKCVAMLGRRSISLHQ